VGGLAIFMWVEFLATWLVPSSGGILAYVLGIGAVVYVSWTRAWRLIGRSGYVVIATIVALAAIYLGMLYLWNSGVREFELAAVRFAPGRTPMPVDNVIPYLLSTRIEVGDSTHALILNWNGGDRPPLETGFVLMTRFLMGGLKISAMTLAFAAGVVAQLVWVPALYSLLRSMGARHAVSILGTIFVGVAATSMINTTYTWPKMLSAALVIAALAVLVSAIRQRQGPLVPVVSAGIFFALGLLAHGAAAFSLPALAILAIVLFHRSGWGKTKWALLFGAIAAFVVYTPWMAYQRFADPPGDRLLKWHLAGVDQPVSQSFVATLVHSYTHLQPSQFLEAKLFNLGVIFDPQLWVGLGSLSEASIGARRYAEYYDTSIALGLATPLLLAFLVVAIVYRVRRIRLSALARTVGIMATLMVMCILAWWAVMFLKDGTVVHQGSHVWILVLLAAPVVLLSGVRRWLGLIAIAAQLALTLVFYIPFFGASSLRFPALALLIAGIALLAAVAWISAQSSLPVWPGRVVLRSQLRAQGALSPEKNSTPLMGG
jgi:hypothetical protein